MSRVYRLILRESLLQSSFPTSARSNIVHTDVPPADICFDLLDPGMLLTSDFLPLPLEHLRLRAPPQIPEES